MKPVYVIGHKNPDIDAIASAIAYARLKSKLNHGAFVPAAAGEVNAETRFVLDFFALEPPELVTDVGTKVEDLLEDEAVFSVPPETTLREAGRLIRVHNIKTLPVVDSKARLLGLLTVGDVAQIYLDRLGQEEEDPQKVVSVLSSVLSTKVSEIMKTQNLVLFEKSETVEEAKKQMLATRYRNYPVVDEENRLAGIISRHHLLQMKRKKVILVDHNEKKQAVEGIEEAEILEIIDHHRVGDLQTVSPIFFRNEPVGATSTLVAELYRQHGVEVEPPVAGLLLSGILSDTMIFRSPTTTGKDKEIAKYLGKIAGLEPESWGKEIFRRAVRVEDEPIQNTVLQDLKEYQHGDLVFAISQVETIDLDALRKRKRDILEAMEGICNKRGYHLLLLMVTDVFAEGTELFAAGPRKEIAASAFSLPLEQETVFLKGVMSRKKQVVPLIYKVLAEQSLF
ncbi:MAG TPA: putative manganese-dependent inorganic diphosphatase [Syntrophothermus lipocalidus]|uniref:inorganic diphosphatase n=1 Tax=Syntrophothermus lipocalidus (strain DSM 12680 / TGB-C1) TaxID=643648 RepID=D7CMD7_SYNLT|nr:putative manganese-dependent inorganic diphosphatase [Syntrophothermus lipocalidus]ADI01872.1 CBS domain containing protein [Syntrophothermus lipocalidus DSM 12680]HHV75776.1 putative manganese-dependent inorganic diphosphatase [Syntrophothermus lipocalidus]